MAQWMQRAPTEGFLSTMLSQMLGGGIRGMQLVNILRGYVQSAHITWCNCGVFVCVQSWSLGHVPTSSIYFTPGFGIRAKLYGRE